MQKVLLATNNAHKIVEMRHALEKLPLSLYSQPEFNIPSVVETGLTFVENAILKARHASQYSELAAIADDSGLIVDALNGCPGIRSARYAHESATDAENINKLLNAIRDVEIESRTARFYCAIAYLKNCNDPAPILCVAQWEGRILFKPQGENGFGYDPIFFIPKRNCSAAELDLKEKTQISHRGQALHSLAQMLQSINEKP